MKKLFLSKIVVLLLFLFFAFLQLTKNSRSLTDGERRELQSIFFDQVDYSKIEILETSLPPSMAAFVIGNHIIFRKEYYVDDFSKNYLRMARMVHEVGHIWANQKKGVHTSLIAMLEHLQKGDQVYAIDDIDRHKRLSDLDYEQQGRLLSDYYKLRYLGLNTSIHESMINKTFR